MPAILPSSRRADHLGELVLERARVDRPRQLVVFGDQAQVDGPEAVDGEGAQVVLDAARSSSGRCAGSQPPLSSRRAPTLETSTRSSGYGCSASRISCVGDVGSVVLGGVDVVDAELDGPAQHRDRLVVVPRRAEHARTGQLHRAEADAVDGVGTERGARHDPCSPDRLRSTIGSGRAFVR